MFLRSSQDRILDMRPRYQGSCDAGSKESGCRDALKATYLIVSQVPHPTLRQLENLNI